MTKTNRHLPRGLSILHEDKDILVVDKPSGLPTLSADREVENTVFSKMTAYVRKGNSKSRERLFVVHRLERDASGVLLFARTAIAKRALQQQWDTFVKKYLVVVTGKMSEPTAVLASYLAENRAGIVFSTDDESKGTLARTGYTVLKEAGPYSLLLVDVLQTRKGQIRAHLAEDGHPIVGDKKYGHTVKGQKALAMHAWSMEIVHPYSGKAMLMKTGAPAFVSALVGSVTLK